LGRFKCGAGAVKHAAAAIFEACLLPPELVNDLEPP
jgi:hypothetical protein